MVTLFFLSIKKSIETLGTFIPTQNASVLIVGSQPHPGLNLTYQPTSPSATVRLFSPLIFQHLSDIYTFPSPTSGPTSCAGKSLALLEMRMVVCSLIQKFEFEFAPSFTTEDWEKNLTDHFVLLKGALPVRIRSRNM